MSTTAPTRASQPSTIKAQLERALLAPIRAFRLSYLPLLMVYFAYGALGLIAVAQSFFEKKTLTMSPADLAALGVWLSLPWAVKMVFGELVDTVGDLRLAAARLRLHRRRHGGGQHGDAGGGGRRLGQGRQRQYALYLRCTAERDRRRAAGRGGGRHEHRGGGAHQRRRHARATRPTSTTTSAWCRRSAGSRSMPAGSPPPGWPAGWRSTTPMRRCSCSACSCRWSRSRARLLVKLEASGESRPTDWRILGGGLAFGAAVVLLGVSDIPGGQELIFLVSLGVIGWMLRACHGRACPRTCAGASSLPPSPSSPSAPRRASVRATRGSRSTGSASTRPSSAGLASSARCSACSPPGSCRTPSPASRSPACCCG